jgi:hypothetical protein
MPHVDQLNCQLQKHILDPSVIKPAIGDFQLSIRMVRQGTGNIEIAATCLPAVAAVQSSKKWCLNENVQKNWSWPEMSVMKFMARCS